MESITAACAAPARYRARTAALTGIRLVRTVAPFVGVDSTRLSHGAAFHAVGPVGSSGLGDGNGLSEGARTFGDTTATARQITSTMPNPAIKRTQDVVLDANWGPRTWSPPV